MGSFVRIFHAFNLGNGRGFSVREVIELAQHVTGKEIPLQIGARHAGDPPRLVGDAKAAESVLHWKQRFGDLSKIIETAWHWHQRNWR